MRRPLLCLDFEGTLISNGISQIPRPGLHDFLIEASHLFDLAIYTSVSQGRATAIQKLLVSEGAAPAWFADLDVIRPVGTLKPKSACNRGDAYLLDDQHEVIAPGENEWWIPIPEFLPPYPEDDRTLEETLARIKELT